MSPGGGHKKRAGCGIDLRGAKERRVWIDKSRKPGRLLVIITYYKNSKQLTSALIYTSFCYVRTSNHSIKATYPHSYREGIEQFPGRFPALISQSVPECGRALFGATHSMKVMHFALKTTLSVRVRPSQLLKSLSQLGNSSILPTRPLFVSRPPLTSEAGKEERRDGPTEGRKRKWRERGRRCKIPLLLFLSACECIRCRSQTASQPASQSHWLRKSAYVHIR